MIPFPFTCLLSESLTSLVSWHELSHRALVLSLRCPAPSAFFLSPRTFLHGCEYSAVPCASQYSCMKIPQELDHQSPVEDYFQLWSIYVSYQPGHVKCQASWYTAV